MNEINPQALVLPKPISRTKVSPKVAVNVQVAPQDVARKSNDSSLIISKEDQAWIKNIVDSGIRAVGRQTETMFDAIADNQFLRVPFRFVSELARNGATTQVQNMMENKKMTKGAGLTIIRKTLENTAATAVFEPNKYQSTVARVGVGFLNMIIRFGARVALVAVNVLEPGDIDLEGVPDEFVSRSFGRIIRPLSSNPIVGLAARFGEQLFINFGLEKLFVKKHLIPKIQNKQAETPAKPAQIQDTAKVAA